MARHFEKNNNDYLDAGNPSHLNLTGDELTLFARMRLESTSSEGKILSKWADSGGQFQYLISTNSDDKCQFAVFPGTTIIALGTSTLATGIWYDLAGTYDGSNARVYCNGTEEDSTPATGNLSAKTAPVRIGAGSGGSGTENPYDGDIGHVAIWDKPLTAGEIESLANGISPLSIRSESLLFYAPLNGQNPEYDVIGGLDLTVNGSVKSEEPPIPNSIVAP